MAIRPAFGLWIRSPMESLIKCVALGSNNSCICAHCVVQREFDRLVKTCENEKVKLPTKRQLEKKAAQLKKFIDAPMTEVRSTRRSHTYGQPNACVE